MITLSSKGDYHKLTSFFQRCLELVDLGTLNKYGQRGLAALQSATPAESGKTANSWYYEITREKNRVKIDWCNSNVVNGYHVAVILQYGHATRNGSWVEGVDYINPAIRPIFDEIAQLAWKEAVG